MRETHRRKGEKGDKQMSHLIQGLHMSLTLPVMQRLWTGRKPAATREGRAAREREGERVCGASPFVGPHSVRPFPTPGRLNPLGVTVPPPQARESTLSVSEDNRYKLRYRI
jgi:hypothetical protein